MVGRMMACRQTWCWRSWEFSIWFHRQQEQRDTGLDLSIWNPKCSPPPQCHISSKKATSPNPCQVAPLPNDQAFKYMSLWGPFLFKPPHLTNFIRVWKRNSKAGNPSSCWEENVESQRAIQGKPVWKSHKSPENQSHGGHAATRQKMGDVQKVRKPEVRRKILFSGFGQHQRERETETYDWQTDRQRQRDRQIPRSYKG